jgi:DNA primase
MITRTAMPKISPETIERIAAANDIVELIDSYFPLKRTGSTYKALCPFHQEKSPSFTVNPQRQIFKCFGCGAGGSVFKFVEQYESLSFPEAVKKLAERAGVTIVEEQLSADEDRQFQMRRRLLSLHQEAAEWFHRNLLKTAEAQVARDYLNSRGVSGEVAKAWKLGYAPDSWDALGNWALEQHYSVEELIASGLVKTKEGDGELRTANIEQSASNAEKNPQSTIQNPKFYDRFRDRVMFPISNDLGGVIAFSGRVLKPEAQKAKYVNSPETSLFTKGKVLFGLHKSKRALIDAGRAIVCEGQLDLITAFEAGIQNVIAPQGTAFTPAQARILSRFAPEVILCFDSDRAGEKATERSLAALLEANLTVRVAEMPAGHDPDSLIRTKGAEAFSQRIEEAKDFFDFQIDRRVQTPEFATPRGRNDFAKKLAEWVSLLNEPVLKQTLVNRIAARLEISARDFQGMLSGPKSQDPQPATRSPMPLNPTTRLLCVLSLRDPKARAWLAAQAWRPIIETDPELTLLGKILETDFDPDDPNSVSAFLSRLTTEDQSAIAEFLLEKLPATGEEIIRDCWINLRRKEIKRRQESLTNQMRLPNLPAEEITRLQKEILDLQERLTDIARPFAQGSSAGE